VLADQCCRNQWPRHPYSSALQDRRSDKQLSPARSPERRRIDLNTLEFGGLLRGCSRTFSPFHRGVVTAYALEVCAAGDGDNRDQSFSAFRAARCSIHEILPDFHLKPGSGTFVPFDVTAGALSASPRKSPTSDRATQYLADRKRARVSVPRRPHLAPGNCMGTCREVLTTRGLPSAWALLLRVSSRRMNFSASISVASIDAVLS
jgi:hypothetical protein